MKKWSAAELFWEAFGLIAAILYCGLQIYYGLSYEVPFLRVAGNVVIMVLVYAFLTLLAVYPERVNGLPKELCEGEIRSDTVWMVRTDKLIFTAGLLFTSICDVMGRELKQGYSLLVVLLIVAVTIFFEYRIIKVLRNYRK